MKGIPSLFREDLLSAPLRCSKSKKARRVMLAMRGRRTFCLQDYYPHTKRKQYGCDQSTSNVRY